uniref:Photosystem II reaction center Psb28 protein n=1 Tax=Bulboplastis apyrenoidosa TaxID=1070855 RepID=A0A1X9PTP5_9RHOD|nr:photosystem II reaction center protein W [Bulboplastis apyrenoidosa]ARO90829.1 photosystem II reaction center protein W [Bulboplastis apyrenoidosa]
MASIQFIIGINEETVPNVSLTRSRDGNTGTAIFSFTNPQVFDINASSQGEISGMYLLDEEGELSTRDVNAKFVNGKPQILEAIYIIKNPAEWDRFMRFMERYSRKNGLTFTKAVS